MNLPLQNAPRHRVGKRLSKKLVFIGEKTMSTYKPPFDNILQAAAEGTVDDVMYFVEQDVRYVNAQSDNGLTPLHCAALRNSDIDVFKYLVHKGASVHIKDNDGNTPLHFAVSSNSNVEILKFLVSKGADVNAVAYFDGKEITPLDFADAEQERAIREALQEKKDNDEMIAKIVVRRGFQIRMLIEGHFLNQGIELKIWLIEGDFGDNDWLFQPGFGFQRGNDKFYLSFRGHTSRFMGNNPNDIVRWIEGDVGIQAKRSYKDDIIAYPAGTPLELVNQVVEICNSAALPQ